MKFVFFDTETTGIARGKDEVVQFACVICDENLRLVGAKSFYCHSTRFISKEASNVTGLTNSKVLELSGGKTFEDRVRDDEEFFYANDTVYVGYNTPFDIDMVNHTLASNGCKKINFGVATDLVLGGNGDNINVDVMTKLVRHFKYSSRRSLSNQVSVHIGTDVANKLFEQTFSKFVNVENLNYHDALYDSFCTYLLFKKFKDIFVL